jgi:hypothetical protein
MRMLQMYQYEVLVSLLAEYAHEYVWESQVRHNFHLQILWQVCKRKRCHHFR